MSEQRTSSEHMELRKRRIWAGVGALTTAIAAVTIVSDIRGQEKGDFFNRLLFADSQVMAGVYGQIQDRGVNNLAPAGEAPQPEYWIEVEQCPQDVEAAKNGDPNQKSFDPDPKVVAPGCIVDKVEVMPGTYKHTFIGEEIRFSGKVGEPLNK